MSDDPPLQQLPPAARTRWRVEGAIVGAVGGLAVSVPLALVGAAAVSVVLALVLPALLLLGGVAAGLTWANRRYARFGYALDEDVLRVVDGVVVHRDAVVPLYRVQHVDLTRGPLQLVFGLATLTIHTAAPAADTRLPDLRLETAEQRRDEILAASRRAAAELGVADVDAV